MIKAFSLPQVMLRWRVSAVGTAMNEGKEVGIGELRWQTKIKLREEKKKEKKKKVR
jgi:hypothetical protein